MIYNKRYYFSKDIIKHMVRKDGMPWQLTYAYMMYNQYVNPIRFGEQDVEEVVAEIISKTDDFSIMTNDGCMEIQLVFFNGTNDKALEELEYAFTLLGFMPEKVSSDKHYVRYKLIDNQIAWEETE